MAIFILLILETDFTTWEGFKKLSSVFSCVILFWAFYFSWGWKWPLLKYIAYTENLNGTWFGNYHSRDARNDQVFEGEISIVIRQTFLSINIVSYTSSYLSYSYGEAVLNNQKNKSHQLVYLYSQNPYEPIDDLARRGTSELQLLLENGEKKLFGMFWTNHNSQGGLTLKKKTSKHLPSFIDAKKYQKK